MTPQSKATLRTARLVVHRGEEGRGCEQEEGRGKQVSRSRTREKSRMVTSWPGAGLEGGYRVPGCSWGGYCERDGTTQVHDSK